MAFCFQKVKAKEFFFIFKEEQQWVKSLIAHGRDVNKVLRKADGLRPSFGSPRKPNSSFCPSLSQSSKRRVVPRDRRYTERGNTKTFCYFLCFKNLPWRKELSVRLGSSQLCPLTSAARSKSLGSALSRWGQTGSKKPHCFLGWLLPGPPLGSK